MDCSFYKSNNVRYRSCQLVQGKISCSYCRFARYAFGDALVYGSSIFVIYKSQHAQARVSLLKGFIMLGFKFIVLVRGLYKLHNWSIPLHQTMSSIGIIALVANLSCLFLLTKHRKDNLNMSSVWLCSRNNFIANS